MTQWRPRRRGRKIADELPAHVVAALKNHSVPERLSYQFPMDARLLVDAGFYLTLLAGLAAVFLIIAVVAIHADAGLALLTTNAR